jgi:hypothetical protein
MMRLSALEALYLELQYDAMASRGDRVKIFLGWSGEISRRAAEAFHNWIPNVLQTVEPFMSEEDIAVGARWSRQLDQELEDSNFGVIFVTPENYDKPWILFEAGALSKSIADARVSPLLVGVSRTTLTGPLTHFQSALPEKADVKRLVASINHACGEAQLDDERLDRVFNTWWDELQPTLSDLVREGRETGAPDAQDRRPDSEILAETLEGVRSLQRAISDPATLVPPDYLEFALERVRGPDSFPPALWRDLERSWRRLADLLENVHQKDDESWTANLAEAVSMLREPIEYLLHESRSKRRVRRPRAVTIEADDN